MTGIKLNREMLFGTTGDEGVTSHEAVLAFLKEENKNDPRPNLNAAGTAVFKGMRDFSLKHILTVGADDGIVQVKVFDTVVRGAEESETLWGQACRVVYMTEEQERIPLITPDDFKMVPWKRGTKARASGGSFWQVPLDCSDDKHLFGVDVGLTSSFVDRKGFDAVEEALWAVGQSVGRLILQQVVAKYTADVDSTMTNAMANWGNSQYKSLVKGESLIAKVGMYPDVILINPDEGYDIGIIDYFIREDYARAARGIPMSLHSMGSLFGRIPILRSRDVTAASMIVAQADKSVVVGIMDGGLGIDNYTDVREGMVGAVAHIQFDVGSGKDAEGPGGATKPTAKAWAVVTAA